MADITPSTHLIRSIRADKGPLHFLVAEAVDNAFDAGAREVVASLLRSGYTFEDDGVGVAKEHELALFRLGETGPLPTTRLGMFGIGIKYQAISAGDILEVTSVSRDGRVDIRGNWEDIASRDRWIIPDPVWTPALRGAVTGTRVRIGKLRWPAPTDRELEKTREELAQIFYPALAAGASIRINDRAVPILAEPAIRDIIEDTVRLPNGKGAHVRAGMLIEQGPLHSVNVSYQHRVILKQKTFGCGEYSGIRALFARVSLIGDWQLARFKNEVVDPDAEALEDVLVEVLHPLLEQCHSAKMSADVEELTELLNAQLPEEMVAVRPPRVKEKGRGGEKGPKRPRGRADGAPESPTGPARSKRAPKNRLLIEFEPGLVEQYGYGRYLSGRPNRIQLAQDNPDIETWRQLRDRPAAVRALYAIALMIYQNAKEAGDPQLAMPFEEFGLRVWNLAKRQKVIPGDQV